MNDIDEKSVSAEQPSLPLRRSTRRRRHKPSGSNKVQIGVTDVDNPVEQEKQTTVETVKSNLNDSSDSLPSEKTQQIGTRRDSRKRRRRRGRKWKPYMKLTWEERKALEQREERRAETTRADRFAHGVPVAPYNTTQFLVDDRQNRSEHQHNYDLDEIVREVSRTSNSGSNGALARKRRHSRSDSVSSSRSSLTATVSNPFRSDMESFAGSTQAVEDVSDGASSDTESCRSLEDDLEREFTREYTSVHAEYLESLDKETLVREYVDLEQKLEDAQVALVIANKDLVALRARADAAEKELAKIQSCTNKIDNSSIDSL